MTRGFAWLLATLVLAGVAVWQMGRTMNAPPPLPVLDTLGGDFSLDATRGERLSLSDFRGKVVLLNFGYTGCPDVCPTALARMRDVLGMLGPVRNDVQPLFVTLDPAVDTVERLTPYVGYFDPELIGLTGAPQEIDRAADLYKVYHQREPVGSGPGYTISHSSHIYLLDPAGRVRATFGEGVPVDRMAATVMQLIRDPDRVLEGDLG